MKYKKIIIIIASIFLVLLIGIASYMFLLSPVENKNDSNIVFVVNKGEGKKEIVANLKKANLVRSKYATLMYIVLSNNKNIQAGSYNLNRSLNTKEIINQLNSGDAIKLSKPSVSITFKEGITLKKYLELISENMDLNYDEMLKTINDKTFVKELTDEYWFLTNDVLSDNIYYALEGYLYPNTYEFYKDSTIESIIKKMLDNTKQNLEKYKTEIENSNYSIHNIMTMASIVEKEAISYTDRQKVAQVIYTRLDKKMSLGMDVTSYYGVGKDMKESLTMSDLNNSNPYNTRLTSFIGLPAGPICNPSIESIKAVLNPADTDYIYFFADITTGNVYFTNDYNEFENFKKIYG